MNGNRALYPSVCVIVLLTAAFMAAAQTSRPAIFLNMAQLTKLAEKGDAAAQCEIGRRYLVGRGMKPSHDEAASWFGKAAAAGSGDGLFELSVMARDGIGMAKDAAKAEKLLTEAAERGAVRAKIALAERATEQTTDTAASDAAVDELLVLARGGDAWAQLALGKAIARGAGKQEGSDALQWLLKSSTAEDERVALEAARVFIRGEGIIRADPARAGMLLRRLVERDVRAAHSELATLAPDSFRGACKEQSIDRVSRDDRLIGAAVRVEGRLVSVEKDEWSIGGEKKGSLRIKLGVDASSSATTGRYSRIWGVVDEPGIVQALLVEIPDPKLETAFKLTEPRIVKGSSKEKYVVNGEVRNTGKQDVAEAKLTVRVFQPESGQEDTETLTITDLPAGQRKVFTTAFTIESVKAADNPTGVVQAEVKVGELKW